MRGDTPRVRSPDRVQKAKAPRGMGMLPRRGDWEVDISRPNQMA